MSDTDKVKCVKNSDDSVSIWFDHDSIEISPYRLLKDSEFIRNAKSRCQCASSAARSLDVMAVSQRIHSKGSIIVDIGLINHGLIKLLVNPAKSTGENRDEGLESTVSIIVKLLNQYAKN